MREEWEAPPGDSRYVPAWATPLGCPPAFNCTGRVVLRFDFACFPLPVPVRAAAVCGAPGVQPGMGTGSGVPAPLRLGEGCLSEKLFKRCGPK